MFSWRLQLRPESPLFIHGFAARFGEGIAVYESFPVFVCGNTEDLGYWKPEDAAALTKDSTQIYQTIRLTGKENQCIQFKLIKSVGGHFVWEEGENRSHAFGTDPPQDGMYFRLSDHSRTDQPLLSDFDKVQYAEASQIGRMLIDQIIKLSTALVAGILLLFGYGISNNSTLAMVFSAVLSVILGLGIIYTYRLLLPVLVVGVSIEERQRPEKRMGLLSLYLLIFGSDQYLQKLNLVISQTDAATQLESYRKLSRRAYIGTPPWLICVSVIAFVLMNVFAASFTRVRANETKENLQQLSQQVSRLEKDNVRLRTEMKQQSEHLERHLETKFSGIEKRLTADAIKNKPHGKRNMSIPMRHSL